MRQKYFRLARFSLLALLVVPLWVSAPVHAMAGQLPFPILDAGDWGIKKPTALAYDEQARKLYAGVRSFDRDRTGLYVFDVAADGSLTGKPREYSDHPQPLASAQYSQIQCIVLDKQHRKLLLGIRSEDPAFTQPLVVYDLDASGWPTGRPRAHAVDTKFPVVDAMALHPRLPRLYIGSIPSEGVSVVALDADGEPGTSTFQRLPGNEKQALGVDPDGKKLYMGMRGFQLQVSDLDAHGDLTGAPRLYYVQKELVAKERSLLTQALKFAVTRHVIAFRAPDGSLGYFPLNANGEPSGEARTLADTGVLQVAASPDGRRLWAATDESFVDARTGQRITSGTQLQEITLDAAGKPQQVKAVSEPLHRQAPAALAAATGSAALATTSLGNDYLGARFTGLHVRVTVVDGEARTAWPVVYRAVKFSQTPKLLKFAYSPSRASAYAAPEGEIISYSLKIPDAKPDAIAAAGVSGPVAVDDAAGILYAARADGTVAMHRLNADGTPAPAGETFATGMGRIDVLCVHPKTHHLYVLGSGGEGAPAQGVLPNGAAIIPLAAGSRIEDAVVDASHGRVYAVGLRNASGNLRVWKLNEDGTLFGAGPAHYSERQQAAESAQSDSHALALDAERKKLYVTTNLMEPRSGTAFLTVFDLNEAGDPAGAPRYFPAASKFGHVSGIALSPDHHWLYETGAGDTAIIAHRMSATGEPTSEHQTALLDGAEAQLVPSTDGAFLLAGMKASRLAIVPLQADGRFTVGLNGVFETEKEQLPLGLMALGAPSQWVSLDNTLKDGVGLTKGLLRLNGADLSRATIKFEAALKDGDRMKPLKTATAEVQGNTAALLLPREGTDAPEGLAGLVQTSADRYRQYLAWAEKYALKPEERPRQFVVANRVDAMDSNHRQALEAGLETLALLGHNTYYTSRFDSIAPAEIKETARRFGLTRAFGGTYRPPSYFHYDTELFQPEALDRWGAEMKRETLKVTGSEPGEVALFHLADEPGWYYPRRQDEVKSNPQRLAVFRRYLQGKGFTPEFFGKAAWDEIVPLKRSEVRSLPAKRLYFWTMRFYIESISVALAASTRELQKQFHEGVLTTTNLNNWPNRSIIPSPNTRVANNTDQGPDAGMGMPDWFDLGRKKAVTAIWTEDWFGFNQSQKWPVYADVMRCAARESGVEYGGYVVGQTLGASAPEAGKYKIMSLVSHGAKAICPYIFGPYWAWADGWSEAEYRYKYLADGLRLLGKGERLLYPGRPRHGTVAILLPQASQAWDPNPEYQLYMHEIYGLHAALMHRNYPVDFVDDFGIEAGDLEKYKYSVLYVSAPNLSQKAQQKILEWTQAGGTVVLLPGAVAADEYNEPTDLLWKASGANRQPVDRANLGDPNTVNITVNDTRFAASTAPVSYQTAPLQATSGKVIATFPDGSAALVAATAGKGRVLSYGFWPGNTYWAGADRSLRSSLPRGWSRPQLDLITAAPRIAGAKKHVEVSHDFVEAALLESEKGVAITLLNWSDTPLDEVTITLPGTGKFSKVSSVEQGVLQPQASAAGLSVKLPLKSVDVVLLDR